MVFRLPMTLPSDIPASSISPEPGPNSIFEGADPIRVPFFVFGVSSPLDGVLISPSPLGGHEIRNLIWVGEFSVLLPVLSLIMPTFGSVSFASHSPNLSRPSGMISIFDLSATSQLSFVQSQTAYE